MSKEEKQETTANDTGTHGRVRNRDQGRGRMGREAAAGPGGECICPNCQEKVVHVAGQPCNTKNCPKCGKKMTRA